MDSLIARDLKLATRNVSSWLPSLLYFVVFMSISIIALDGDTELIQISAAGLIWMAALMSLMITFPQFFRRDVETGMMEQFHLSGLSFTSIVVAKAISTFIIFVLPLLIILPFITLALGLDGQAAWTTSLSIFIGAPAIIFYGLVTGAILSRIRSGGFIGVIITIPFLIPVLIFGIGAAQLQIENPFKSGEIKALLGLDLISAAIGIPATIAALKTNME